MIIPLPDAFFYVLYQLTAAASAFLSIHLNLRLQINALLLVRLHQKLLLPCTAHVLDLIFTLHGFLLCSIYFIICYRDRSTPFCIFCPFPCIVVCHTLVQVICPSSIQGAVTAPQDIRIIRLFHFSSTASIYVKRAHSPGCQASSI